MKIKSISWFEMGKGVFFSKYGLVETKEGQKYIYTLEYNDTWENEEDYFDNIKSDFKNEHDNDFNFGNDEMGLFVKLELWTRE